MNPYNLDISGDWDTDPAVLEKFSRDMSAYRIVPALVVAPKNEEDVLRTLRFAHNEGLGIVSRSGGSDLSGASIGPGINGIFGNILTGRSGWVKKLSLSRV